MTAVTADRIPAQGGRRAGATASVGRLAGFLAAQRDAVSIALRAAAAYQQADTDAARRAALQHYLSAMQN